MPRTKAQVKLTGGASSKASKNKNQKREGNANNRFRTEDIPYGIMMKDVKKQSLTLSHQPLPDVNNFKQATLGIPTKRKADDQEPKEDDDKELEPLYEDEEEKQESDNEEKEDADSDASDDEQENKSSQNFNVEKILDKKTSGLNTLYKVKWEGYPLSAASWEPRSNLTNCKEILAEFEKNWTPKKPIEKKKKQPTTTTTTTTSEEPSDPSLYDTNDTE